MLRPQPAAVFSARYRRVSFRIEPAPSLTSDPAAESLFCQRSFMRLWLARIAAIAGGQMVMVAVGWQMYDTTG